MFTLCHVQANPGVKVKAQAILGGIKALAAASTTPLPIIILVNGKAPMWDKSVRTTLVAGLDDGNYVGIWHMADISQQE